MMMLLTALIAPAAALVATSRAVNPPKAPGGIAAQRANVPCTMLLDGTSRRSVITGVLTSMIAAQSASAKFFDADAKLEKELLKELDVEAQKVKAESDELRNADLALKSARGTEFYEENALRKAQDDVIAAMKRGDDPKTLAKLEAKLMSLQKNLSKDQAIAAALERDVDAKAAEKAAEEAKLQVLASTVTQVEDRIIREEEEESIVATLGAAASDILSKYVK